ncbi:MAG: hypothetical protein IJX77_06160 [Ruminococcus sp.]|nr:hypothetical protein [Ruminococcus sp.]
MELKEIAQRLSTLKIPVAYSVFNTPQKLPFVVYYESGADIQGADTYNLYRDAEIRICLYCDKKDIALERRLEELFRDVELDKTEIYIPEEKMLEIAYSFDTIQKTN